MDDVKWVAPSEVPHRRNASVRGERLEFVAALRARPGEWAQFRPGYGWSASAGSVMKRECPGVEATMRMRDDRRYDLFVRWVGNGDES